MKELKKMMKQVQKMQGQMAAQQEKLETKTYEASAGGGMVVATVNGKMEVISLSIKTDVIDPEDPEMLQDLVLAAVNEALRNSREDAEQSLKSVTDGLGLPPGLF